MEKVLDLVAFVLQCGIVRLGFVVFVVVAALVNLPGMLL